MVRLSGSGSYELMMATGLRSRLGLLSSSLSLRLVSKSSSMPPTTELRRDAKTCAAVRMGALGIAAPAGVAATDTGAALLAAAAGGGVGAAGVAKGVLAFAAIALMAVTGGGTANPVNW